MCLLCGQNLSKRIHNRDKLIQQSIFVNGMSSGIPHGRHLLIIQKRCVERYNTEDGPRQQIKSRKLSIVSINSGILENFSAAPSLSPTRHNYPLLSCKTARLLTILILLIVLPIESCLKSLSLSHLSTN